MLYQRSGGRGVDEGMKGTRAPRAVKDGEKEKRMDGEGLHI